MAKDKKNKDEKELSFEELLKQGHEKDKKNESTQDQRTRNQSKQTEHTSQQDLAGGFSQSYFESPRYHNAGIAQMALARSTQNLHKTQAQGTKAQDREGDNPEFRSEQESQESHQVESGSEELRSLDENEISSKLNADEQRKLEELEEQKNALEQIQQESLASNLKLIDQGFKQLQNALKDYIKNKDDPSIQDNKKLDLKVGVLLNYQTYQNAKKHLGKNKNLDPNKINPKEQEILNELKLNKESIIQDFTKRVKEKIKEYNNKQNKTPYDKEATRLINFIQDLKSLNPKVEFSRKEKEMISALFLQEKLGKNYGQNLQS